MTFSTITSKAAYVLALAIVAIVAFSGALTVQAYDYDYDSFDSFDDYYGYGGYEDYGGGYGYGYEDYGYGGYDDYGYGYDDCYYDDCYDYGYEDYGYDDYGYGGYDDCYDDCYDDYGGGYDYSSGNISIVNDNYNYNSNTNTNVNTNVREDIEAFCIPSISSGEVGDTVIWTVTQTGSNKPLYHWTGSDGLSGNTAAVSKTYTSRGTKSAAVTITSTGGKRSTTVNCGSVIIGDRDDDDDDDDNDNDEFDLECIARPDEAEIGETVRWIAEVDGVDEDDVDFEWSGDADGDDQEVTERYNREGTYRARVRAEYRNETETATCEVDVEDDDRNRDSRVSVISTPTFTPPPALSSVYLSQIPYTGASENAKIVGFILTLILASIAGAYMIVTRKVRGNRKALIDAFKQENLSKKALA